MLGPTGVGLYRISVARVLGDYGTAVEAARRINPAGIPLVERCARYWSDIVHSYHAWNKLEQCYRALLAAEHASPEEVRLHLRVSGDVRWDVVIESESVSRVVDGFELGQALVVLEVVCGAHLLGGVLAIHEVQ